MIAFVAGGCVRLPLLFRRRSALLLKKRELSSSRNMAHSAYPLDLVLWTPCLTRGAPMALMGAAAKAIWG